MSKKPPVGSVQEWCQILDTNVQNRDGKIVKVLVYSSVVPEWGFVKLHYQVRGERSSKKHWYGETAHQDCVRYVNDITGNWIHLD